MTSYLLEPIDLIFVKGYGFFALAKNMRKNIVKNIRNHLSGKCNQKRLNHTKQSSTDAIKTAPKRATQKTAEQLMIWLIINLLITLQKSQELHDGIIQR